MTKVNHVKTGSTRKTLRNLFLAICGVAVALTLAQMAQAQTNTFPSSGNAGIGTTTPTYPLDVLSSAQWAARFKKTDATHGGIIIDSATGFNPNVALSVNGTFKWYLNNNVANGDTLQFWESTGQYPRFTLTQAGNLGIGTTSPGGPIDVRDSGGRQILWNMASDGHTFINANGGNVHVAGNLYFNGTNWNRFNTAAPGGIWWAGNDGTLAVIQTPAGANPVSAVNWNFFIGTNGNVGIGSITPSYKLDVQNGQINASGGLCIAGDCKTAWSQVGGGGGSSQWTTSGSNINYNTGNVGIGTTAPVSPLEILKSQAGVTAVQVTNNSTSAGNGAMVRMFTATNNALSLGAKGDAGAGGYAQINQEANLPLLLLTNNTERVRITGGGNVGIGNASPTEKLHVTGNAKITENLTVDGTINAKYQDVAEWVPSSEQLSAGTVVVLDSTKSNQVISSTTGYDTRVAGVISAQPGIALGESGEGKVLVATTGRVRVKVDATRAPIRIGDLLVTSDIPGVAMKSEPIMIGGRQMHSPGTLIGKALEPLAKGKGEILVLLSLQ